MAISGITPQSKANDNLQIEEKNSTGRIVKENKEVVLKNTQKSLSENSFPEHASQKLRTIRQVFISFLSIAKKQASKMIDTIKNFFDEISTQNDICKFLGISKNEWKKLPNDLRFALVKTIISNNNDDETATNKYNLIEKFSKDLNDYIQPHYQKYGMWNTTMQEIQNLFNAIEALKIDIGKEKEQEERLNAQLSTIFQKNPSRAEKALAISKTLGGESISKDIEIFVNCKKINVKTEAIPQKQLSGFGEDRKLKQVASEFQGKTPNDHASNLWQQKITVGEKPPVSFIRFGNTRGNESATKEILANALTAIYSEETIFGATEEHPLTLNFTNVQLMTPGILGGATDEEMPQQQMETFNELAKREQPLKFTYRGKEIFVCLQKPLLFNFGVNVQHFSSLFKPIINHTKCDQQNDESFRNLFGDLKLFGGQQNEQKIDGHYAFNEDSLIGKKLAESGLNSNTKEQILSLADQIIDICHSDKNGVKTNPYALPSRVAMLTNLLGYATSYNCKSGKDRTGIMAIELENLAAKILEDNKPYAFEGSISQEEQQNLQSIYKAGTSVEIAKINTGNVQKGLKIEQLGGLFTSVEERFGIEVSKDFYANRHTLSK